MHKSQFIIIKHEAKKAGLHYDLRFKMPNSNKWDSYAVRKGIPEEPGKKVVAIKTTIHTEKEALMTGIIKDGYGAGKLTKWDSGSCDIIKESTTHKIIDFKGSKIKGIYHFINTGFTNNESYILFKGKIISET